MSAKSLRTVTLVFPSPDWPDVSHDGYEKVNSSISFDFLEQSVRTLSTNTASSGTDVTGLFFTPDLTSQACINASLPFVSPNATRRGDLPDEDFDLVAISPWLDPPCTLEYLSTVQPDTIKGYIFYLTDNGTDTPPLPNSAVWGLGDGGRWKSDSKFPVYAIPGMSGSIIMNQLALYSKNMTDVPHGSDLVNVYNPTDYVRLFADVATESSNTLPSLWVFLLVVLAILIFIIGTTSLLMHLIQRRRRQQLRRRVANGEVDLEALGIKRLTVPQEVLDKMPQYLYTSDTVPAVQSPRVYTTDVDPEANKEMSSSSPRSPNLQILPRRLSDPTSRVTPAAKSQTYSQPTCAICLDDFVPSETIVRELPCRHIFHPSCVDSFLLSSSSLCPLCKKSTLPQGYCPAVVTNSMVRRERVARRRRIAGVPHRQTDGGTATPSISDRGSIDTPSDDDAQNPQGSIGRRVRGTVQSAGRRVRDFSGGLHIPTGGRRIFSAPTPSTVEMRASASMTPAVPTAVIPSPTRQSPHGTSAGTAAPGTEAPYGETVDIVPPPPSESATGHNRREWARQRALTLLGTRHAPAEEAQERPAGDRPRWRKVVGAVWPGTV